jgi:hypothetical protein
MPEASYSDLRDFDDLKKEGIPADPYGECEAPSPLYTESPPRHGLLTLHRVRLWLERDGPGRPINAHGMDREFRF